MSKTTMEKIESVQEQIRQLEKQKTASASAKGAGAQGANEAALQKGGVV